MRKSISLGLIFTGLTILTLNCAPSPSANKEMLGKVRGKTSLQLADGSTISRGDSDEYNPYVVKLSDGYLVLVFGSNRTCGVCSNHNIFMTKSVSAYDGISLPSFNPPVVVTDLGSPLNQAQPIQFAAIASGTSVVLYVNNSGGSIFKGTVTNPNAPSTSSSMTPIANTTYLSHSIIGVNAAGDRLITKDAGEISYIVDPDSTATADAYGMNMDYSESVTQVRFDNTGFNDSYMGVYFGSSFATTQASYFGPIVEFNISLMTSGLYITSINSFYGNSAYEDLVLFTAYDGTSDDIYVVTSHTSGMLWDSVVAFQGTETFLPPSPFPDHWYDMESGTSTFTDVGYPGGWNGTGTSMTQTPGSYDGTNYATFDGSLSYINLGSVDPGSVFTIVAAVYIPGATTCVVCTIAANTTSATDANGFKFYIDSSTMTIKFETGDGAGPSSGIVADSYPGVITADAWYQVAVTVNKTSGIAFIYVNGALVSLNPLIDTTFATSGSPLEIGRMSGPANVFDGDMENVLIYSYEVSPLEMLAIYFDY